MTPRIGLFTGTPAFGEPRMVGRPNIVDRDRILERIGGALDRVWLTNNGPLVRELEARLAEQLEVRNCVATANATVALELLVHTLGLTGEVLVPSWTFIATSHAVRWTGLDPAFADVDARTHCLDPVSVEAAITPATSAILGVHVWGWGCDVDALDEIAVRHGLHVIYDAAPALGARLQGRPIGGFGRAEVFSLHATKMVTSFEGGVISTDDDSLADALRKARNFGFSAEDEVAGTGINAKMSEPAAAMGLTSLEAIERLMTHNREVHAAYRDALRPVPGVDVRSVVPDGDSNRHYVVVEVDVEAAGLTRDEIVDTLRFDNVMARRYFSPGCHRMEPYRTTHPDAGSRLPVTEALSDRVMVLPTGLAVDSRDATRIVELIACAVDHAPLVQRSLARVPEERLLALGP